MRFDRRTILAAFAAWPTMLSARTPMIARRRTEAAIVGDAFQINGRLTYAGRRWNGRVIEGLLLNSRMVQGTFDDENAETRSRWAKPGSGPFNADANTQAFVAEMPQWRRHGLLSFTLNLQGGSPEGYSREQPWINSAFDFQTGKLKPAYMGRLELILNAADRLGMVPVLGLFYFGQAWRFTREEAVIAATDAITDWVMAKGYRNVLIEIANECDVPSYPAILQPTRAHELILRVQQRSTHRIANPASRLLVSTSYQGRSIPGENVAAVADFLLLHGNSVNDPAGISKMIERTRALKAYRGQPLIFNEDDNFDFDKPMNNFLAALDGYASWGYFDWRMAGENLSNGYQSMPVDWGMGSARKRSFFRLLAEITGSRAQSDPTESRGIPMRQEI